MTLRIKFAKYGSMRYIGHLDVLRSMQKAVSRAKIDIAFSEGFHPHMLLTFAAPLGMAVTSDGEYMDMELCSEQDPKAVTEALNREMPEGFAIIDARRLPDYVINTKKETAMSLVALADYEIAFRADKYNKEELEKIKSVSTALFMNERFEISKDRKSATETVDIKPYILMATYDLPEFTGSDDVIHAANNALLHTNSSENDLKLYIRVSCGSKMNIRPDHITGKILDECGLSDREYSLRLHRMELYRKDNDKYMPL